MALLAIDTSLTACSAALLPQGANSPIQRFEPMTRGHAEAIFPMIEAAMAEAGCGYGDLEKLAVTIGPGSFTGVRAGVAAVRGLALAAKRPAVGGGTLEVMARGASRLLPPAMRESGFAVVHDARRDEVYFQQFDAKGAAVAGPQVLSLGEALTRLPDNVELVLGSGAQILAEAAQRQGRTIRAELAALLPEARDLAMIARDLAATGHPPVPLYLRPPDAKPQTDKSVARANA
ncbi:MAG: tRNA (adenosine(37)-N6)-threonylcarbamoyltransferase complex dimerization subunit type 1 TsaB [Rhodomicrobiaceae bacterium]